MINYFKISTLNTTINIIYKWQILFNTNCALRLLADCLNNFKNK